MPPSAGTTKPPAEDPRRWRRRSPYEQPGNAGGNIVPALFFDQQLSLPIVSQARSTAKIAGSAGSGLVPFPFTRLFRTWLPSGFGSMSSAAHSDGDRLVATQ